MEYLGILGIFAFIWCMTLSGKVKRLEQIIKANGLADTHIMSLQNVLKNYIGKTVKISLYNENLNWDFSSKECLIEDLDEVWALVRVNPDKKNEMQKLIKIDLIKNITI